MDKRERAEKERAVAKMRAMDNETLLSEFGDLLTTRGSSEYEYTAAWDEIMQRMNVATAVQSVIATLPETRPTDTLQTLEVINGTRTPHLTNAQVDMVTYAAIRQFEIRKQIEAAMRPEAQP